MCTYTVLVPEKMGKMLTSATGRKLTVPYPIQRTVNPLPPCSQWFDDSNTHEHKPGTTCCLTFHLDISFIVLLCELSRRNQCLCFVDSLRRSNVLRTFWVTHTLAPTWHRLDGHPKYAPTPRNPPPPPPPVRLTGTQDSREQKHTPLVQSNASATAPCNFTMIGRGHGANTPHPT